MKRLVSLMLTVLVCLSMVSFIPCDRITDAATTPLPTPTAPENNELVPTSNGYMRVVVEDTDVTVEYYDRRFTILSQKKIPVELDFAEKFYAGKDYYFIAFGHIDNDIDADAEVVRIVKYDRNWNRLGAASFTAGPGRDMNRSFKPFSNSNTDMVELDGTLYVVAGEADSHQGLVRYNIDIATMTGQILSDGFQHSFSHYMVAPDKDNMFLAEDSDYLGGIILWHLKDPDSSSTFDQYYRKSILRNDYGRSRGQRSYNPNLYDIDLSSDNVLIAGASPDQDRLLNDPDYQPGFNVYLISTPRNADHPEPVLHWITTDGTDSEYIDIRLVKINDDRFMVLWQPWGTSEDNSVIYYDHEHIQYCKFYYCFVDGSGNMTSAVKTVENASLSSCDPIVDGNRVVFCSSDETSVGFFILDINRGNVISKFYNYAGPSAFWSYDESAKTLTISGTGAIDDRFSYNALHSDIFQATDIVIANGITSIGSNAFGRLIHLRNIELPSSLTQIASNALPSNCLVYMSTPLSSSQMPDSAFPVRTVLTRPDGSTYVITAEGSSGNAIQPSEPIQINIGVQTSEGVEGFIERLYLVALGRDFDPNGKADWLNRVRTQGYTGADLARGFLFSDEFLGKNMSDRDFLRVLYATFFDREADDQIENWLMLMSSGWSKTDVINGFINSTEWANLCLRYRIASGSTFVPNITVEPTDDIIAFATRLYTTCLGRDADTAGLNDWADQLANMRISGSEAAHGFFFSTEFINGNYSNIEYVTRLYRTFMNREPDAAGFADWVGQLENGTTRESVFNGFAGSQEWAEICAEYGILK